MASSRADASIGRFRVVALVAAVLGFSAGFFYPQTGIARDGESVAVFDALERTDATMSIRTAMGLLVVLDVVSVLLILRVFVSWSRSGCHDKLERRLLQLTAWLVIRLSAEPLVADYRLSRLEPSLPSGRGHASVDSWDSLDSALVLAAIGLVWCHRGRSRRKRAGTKDRTNDISSGT